jgi:hypothetical protein
MRLSNGTVLPHGLLGLDIFSNKGGFEKTYKNFALRAGIVIRSYGIEDSKNVSKLVPEYDVVVIEQDANRAVTPITYRNCIAASSFGSIADFFEARLRTQDKVKNKQTKGRDFAGQDGAIVLLLCLDGSSEKGIIIGALPHPDRKSKLKGKGKILAGEFNGLSISVADDGSANLTFKGATDNEGNPLDKEQGNTTIDIEKDGTIQFKHKGAVKRIEKGGNYLLKNEGTSLIESKKATTIKTDDALSTVSKADTSMKMDKFLLEAQGSASMKAQSFDVSGKTKIDLKSQMISITGESQIKAQASQITLEGQVFLGGAGGQPVVLPTTQFIGTGNYGLPVLSTAIGPFATKTFAT